MPYEVIGSDVTIPRSLSVTKNPDGTETHDHVSQVYTKGSVLGDEAVSPVVQKLLEDGDPHVSSQIRYVDAEEVDKLRELSEGEQRKLQYAAEDAALGPAPRDVGITGVSAAPGVIDPAAASTRAYLEVEQGAVPGTVPEGELESELSPEQQQAGDPFLQRGDAPVLDQSEGSRNAREGSASERARAASDELDEGSNEDAAATEDKDEQAEAEAKAEAKKAKAEAKKSKSADADEKKE